jgi:hypothetical protein
MKQAYVAEVNNPVKAAVIAVVAITGNDMPKMVAKNVHITAPPTAPAVIPIALSLFMANSPFLKFFLTRYGLILLKVIKMSNRVFVKSIKFIKQVQKHFINF